MISPFLAIPALLGAPALATNARTPTPQMGWNSYNGYSCYPNETIIQTNAQALVDLGLAELGYKYVTPDCGWNSPGRDEQGRQIWNPDLFPSGGKALSDFVHALGLKFGMYSGGGYYQCGSTDQPASLGYEETDAAAYAEWGADSLKYDNCYANSEDTMVDNTDPVSTGSERFEVMAAALDAVDRDILYQICQWGIGEDIGRWAPALGTSWRISNDIYSAWRSIWRIANEVAPYPAHGETGPGRFADMDMLIVGLHALSEEEEKFHFGMWSIMKSPLIIGAALVDIPDSSLEIISNQEVIDLNQDPLAQSATLVRRDTTDEWDIWAGELSGGRMVVGIANWKNETQTAKLNLADVGVQYALARDVWAAQDIGELSGSVDVELKGHELKLYVLSDITMASTDRKSTGYYPASEAILGGIASLTQCDIGQCLPEGTKVGYLGGSSNEGTATFPNLEFSTAGTKTLGIDFINYDIATDSAWGWGANVRNVTFAVNGGEAIRWAMPISGGNWYESGRLVVEVDGFLAGNNTLVVSGDGENYAIDLVGIETFEEAKAGPPGI